MSDVTDPPESNAPRAEEPPTAAAAADVAPPSAAGAPAPPPTGAPAPQPVSAPAPAARPRRRTVRRVLLSLGPLVVLVGGLYAYLATGRFVSTDNAYVKSDIGVVSALVSGPIVEVAVREN